MTPRLSFPQFKSEPLDTGRVNVISWHIQRPVGLWHGSALQKAECSISFYESSPNDVMLVL